MVDNYKAYRLVVGLGNPGPKYVDSRHNFGFLCLEQLSELCRHKPGWCLGEAKQKDRLAYWERWNDSHPADAILVWPLTYMNLSGHGVGYVVEQAGCPPLELLVIVDDMSLPLGQLRLREKGSSGGHNGLKSIEALLESKVYPRLRLGIGAPPPDGSTVDFVLEKFTAAEAKIVKAVAYEAALIAMGWLEGAPIGDLMAQHNGWKYGK